MTLEIPKHRKQVFQATTARQCGFSRHVFWSPTVFRKFLPLPPKLSSPTSPLLLALLLLLLPACQATRISRANDTLRRENLELNRQIQSLRQDLRRSEQRIEVLQQQVQGNHEPQTLPEAVPPQLSELTIDRFSAMVDEDKDGQADTLRLYLKTLDGRGRFLVVAGRAVVRVLHLPTEGDPQVLAERTFDPPEFDQAYRSGLTGTHYSLSVPLPQPLPEEARQLTVQVTFTEARTGADLTQQTTLPIPGRR